MQRSAHTAREIQEELERVASVLCERDEDLQLDFSLPEPASGEWPFKQNWDVRVAVPDGLEPLAFRAIQTVAAHWDLQTP